MTVAPEIRNFAGSDPVLRYIFPINPDSTVLGKWQRTFDYDVWTQCHQEADDPLTLWEKVPGGVVRVPKAESVMHVISAGIPHHIAGLFGYWRTCGSDIIWLRIVRDGFVHEAMVLGGCPSAYEQDSISWICPSCATEFGKVDIATGRKSGQRFWAEEAKAVAKFNDSPEARTCPNCSRVHPLAYSFRTPDVTSSQSDLNW